MAGQIGYVAKIYINGNVQVYVRGRGLVFNPLCLEPAPGETAPYTPDPQSNNCYSYTVYFILLFRMLPSVLMLNI